MIGVQAACAGSDHVMQCRHSGMLLCLRPWCMARACTHSARPLRMLACRLLDAAAQLRVQHLTVNLPRSLSSIIALAEPKLAADHLRSKCNVSAAWLLLFRHMKHDNHLLRSVSGSTIE